MKIVLTGRTEGPAGKPFRKEWTVGSFTDVQDRYILIDEDGEGRLVLTAEELADIGGIGGEK